MADNTIEALRILQLGPEAVKAVGTQVWAVQPTAGKTFVIGGCTYSAVASGASTAGQINVGADLAAWKVNVVRSINGGDSWTPVNPYAKAGVFSSNNLPITARIPGPAGNLVVFTMPTPDSGNSVNGTGFLGTTTAGAMARGTAATPIQRWPIESLEWSNSDANLYKPKVQNGVLARNRGRSTPVHNGTRFSLKDQAAIWEALHLYLAGVVSGVPVQTGSFADPITLTFTADPTTNPNLMAYTIERQFDTGLGSTVEERATYCMFSELGFSFAVAEELKVSGGQGFGRKFNTNAITDGLTLTDFETMVSALSEIYMDNTYGGIGGTLIDDKVIGWNTKIMNGAFPRDTAEARTDLDFSKYQINGEQRGQDAEITSLLEPTFYDAEQTHASAGDIRYVRIHIVGSNSRVLNLDMLMQHTKPGPWQPGIDQGQDIVNMILEDLTDNSHLLSATLTMPSAPVW